MRVEGGEANASATQRTPDRSELAALLAAVDAVAPRRSRATTTTISAATAIGYIRVSTAEQAASGLGLAAQRSAIEADASRRGLRLVAILSDEGVGGGSLARPALGQALDAMAAGDASALLVMKLD